MNEEIWRAEQEGGLPRFHLPLIMASHTPPPLELEATTSEPSRTVAPAENVPGLTVAECAAAYGLSETTVRRLVKGSKGKPPKVNASKVTGPKGVEYRISPASMEVLGYEPKATQSGALLTASRANLEAETLAAKVRELEASLIVANLLRESAEKESALLAQSLNDLREVISKLPKALPPVEPLTKSD